MPRRILLCPSGGTDERVVPCPTLSHKQAFYHITEILQQVPPIGHLPCLRCPTRHPFHNGSATVARDETNRRMRREPGGNRRGGAIGQHIERSVCVNVHDKTRIRATLAEGEVVHPDTLRRANVRQRRGADESEQDIGSGWDAEGGSEACPGLATEGEGHPFKGGAQMVRATATGSDEGGQALSEDVTGAAGVDAAKAPHMEVQDHRHTANGEIGDMAQVATVDAARATMAQGASSGAAHGGGGETHLVVMHGEIVNVQPGEVGEKGGDTHGV